MNQITLRHLLLTIATLIFVVLLYLLSPIVLPLCFSIILAYILNPLVSFMCKIKTPRIVAITVIFIFGLIILGAILIVLIPLLEKQLLILINKIPVILTWVQTKFNLHLDMNFIKKDIFRYLQTGGNMAKHVWSTVMRSGRVFIEVLANLVLIPVITFYILRDWQTLTTNFMKLLPRAKKDYIVAMINECGEVLAAFFRGQLLVMLGLGILYAIGLTIVGLDTALLIGFAAGLLSIVPYLGFIIGFGVSLIVAAIKFHTWQHLLGVCIVFAVGHIAESYVLQPSLVGNRIGLHPVAVIFAIAAGGLLLGFVGIIIALPVAAVIMVLLRHLITYYTHTAYYNATDDKKL
ncbi:MAG: AI-2E family transporter [Pseudomonadota bacterium]